ncbi:MAG TPA: DUF4124 domain-containing protein [Usitatibacter sp.]|nr:DUF4124 domain-containing protein [Usitatibacter sp.]
MQKLSMAFLGLVFMALPASAQTLYKLIDKDGKVTYSEAPPKEFDGKVIRMDIDPNANTATMPKPPAPARPQGVLGERSPAETARYNVAKARKALEEARDNPADSDYRIVGNVGTGGRRVLTDEYSARVAALEAALKRAENEARKFEEAK